MTIEQIEYLGLDRKQHSAEVSGFPDKCPGCRQSMRPVPHGAYQVKDDIIRTEIALVFQCPIKRCRRIFMGYYFSSDRLSSYYVLNTAWLPLVLEDPQVPDTVKKLSVRFDKAYAHAYYADKNGLREVCGCGYRRALELLIKDYLISKHSADPEKTKQIEAKRLGRCIDDDINDSRIKEVAKRAAWLGNDETHYVRKWEDHDLENLRQLIELTMYWINAELTTKKYLDGMPE